MARKASAERHTTHKQIEDFERVANQLGVLHKEFAAQAKSKPDNPINKFKLTMLNEKIAAANVILAGEFKAFDNFTAFDEADLPSNSDVSFVLATYLSSLERWRSAHVYFMSGEGWVWATKEAPVLSAGAPSSYRPEA